MRREMSRKENEERSMEKVEKKTLEVRRELGILKDEDEGIKREELKWSWFG